MKIRVEKLAKVKVNPGDVIVLTLPHVYDELLSEMEQGLREIWPNNRCVILESGAELAVVTGGAA